MIDKYSENLESGTRSRLIPVGKIAKSEVNTIGPCLAMMSLIPDLARALLSDMGCSYGVRTRVHCFSEVMFKRPRGAKELKHVKPDGLIVVANGKNRWRALVEAKIGANDLNIEQIEDYLALAKEQGIDAVITVSNQFTQAKNICPLPIKKTLLNKVGLYHLSWSNLLTTALLVKDQDQKSSNQMDQDHARLLEELIRFLDHDQSGVSGFNSMNPEWKDFVLSASADRRVKSSEINYPSALAWVSESQDIALRLSRLTGERTKVRLRREEKDPKTGLDHRIERLIDEFCQKSTFSSVFDVPGLVSPLEVKIDLHGQTCTIAMKVDAPKDRKRVGRLSWFHRQVRNLELPGAEVSSLWRGGGQNPTAALEKFCVDREVLDSERPKAEPSAFSICYKLDKSGNFVSRKKFVTTLEAAIEDFYRSVAQHIENPNPVRPAKARDNALMDL